MSTDIGTSGASGTSGAADAGGTPGTPGARCRTDRRRHAVRAARLNGVDGVEAADDGHTLTVTFLGKAPGGVGPQNVRIDGGRRVTGLRAVEVHVETEEDPELDDRMHVVLDRTGDTSAYRLSIVETDAHGRPGTTPYRGFDQRYHSAGFSFRPGRPTPFDCAAEEPCPAPLRPAPLIDRTARDYERLLRTVLDRMALTAPEWAERHVPDLGVTVAELLAYTADRLAHHQDAVATEAYLDTARRRESVRRHARLVDYAMHDGAAARAFVALETDRPVVLPRGAFRFAAVDTGRLDPRDRPELGTVLADEDLDALPPGASQEVFEPLGDAEPALYPAHNAVRFWTWGDEECVLPRGAVSATLRDEWADRCDGPGPRAGGPGPGTAEAAAEAAAGVGTDADTGAGTSPETEAEAEAAGRPGGGHPGGPPRPRERVLRLRPGDILVLEEVVGPRTGSPADADPAHRQAVRLTSVTPLVDRLCDQPVLEVSWDRADALAFPLCLSSRGGTDCRPLPDVSVARANVVAVEHGRSLTFCGGAPERFTVPPAPVVVAPCDCGDGCGCGEGGGSSEAALALHGLLDLTRSGRRLTPARVRSLHALLGEAEVTRAGLEIRLVPGAGKDTEKVEPPTASEQAERLETLLARSSYPPVPVRFRPVLRHAPVTRAAPHPDPRRVSAAQAEHLAAVPERVRERLEELWRAAEDGRPPGRAEIAELTVLFGARVLEEVRLRERPAHALRELLARRRRLLRPRLTRLEILTARARAGGVLDRSVVWEVAHTWGEPYAAGLDPDDPVLAGPAAALATDPRAALPAVRVSAGGRTWTPRRDLLASGPRDAHFVGETGNDGRLTLRFGDGRHGAAPPPGERLEVFYRIGNGAAGNVGAEAVNHLVLCRGGADRAPAGTGTRRAKAGRRLPVPHAAVLRVRNPLPAVGGTEPEPLDDVRRLAPLALRRTGLRAVTAEDYAALAAALPGVQRAAAQLRWTGSVQEVHVAVDPLGAATAPPGLLAEVARALEAYRRIGHDLVVRTAPLVPLDIELTVCAAPGHQRGQVLAALRRALGTGVLPDGRPGFFHPDALTFGEPVRASRLVAAAAAVPGVADARVTRLRRLFRGDDGELDAGLLRTGPLEVAQCDNDPDRPENGRLKLVIGGGR
ncbi:putative baseplate assembly protein [Streptomyces sp. HB2AG]|uniref:putative baseplate assembly protein n=1 Tax=Streptomyces sp. HB2AG TaxID=2983400 RepID=UPI0022AB4D49|nr:putative baseplate assembly protein [Streptomyces sp. HB2AG]MCZ2523699.1 putative baseplate assembly protein [Streptomyces sp. HB2AG]